MDGSHAMPLYEVGIPQYKPGIFLAQVRRPEVQARPNSCWKSPHLLESNGRSNFAAAADLPLPLN